MGQVVVVGSANMDLVVRVPRLPRPGETVLGGDLERYPGGKGANQAAASARLGAPTAMAGRVGRDEFGGVLREALSGAGVNVVSLATDPDRPTGVALIAVDPDGMNLLIPCPGANGAVVPSDVPDLAGAWVVLQLEIPVETVAAVADRARGRTILNPAPASPVPEEVWKGMYLVTPNETEAQFFTGIDPTDPLRRRECAEWFLARGVENVVITLGAQGAYHAWRGGERMVPVHPVVPIDTTAAGDAFTGAVAAGLAQGLPLDRALDRAAVAAALSTTRPGALPSLATAAEVDAAMAR